MWDLIVSVPDHCLSFYFALIVEVSAMVSICGLYWTLVYIETSHFFFLKLNYQE